MDNPHGRILELHDDAAPAHALVLVDAAVQCARCASGKGCGAGIFGSREARRIEARVASGLSVRAGDTVRIELAPQDLLRAAVMVYGIPLIGGVGSAALAYIAGGGDLAAACAALLGLAAGLAVSRRQLRRAHCLRALTPVITARLAAGGS